MTYLKVLVAAAVLLLAYPSIAADGDHVANLDIPSGVSQADLPQKFKLCDGSVSSASRTCPVFNIWAKVGGAAKTMTFSVDGSGSAGATGCDPGATSAVYLLNESAGTLHDVGATLSDTFSSRIFDDAGAPLFQYVQVITSGLANCTDYTIYGVFKK